MSDENISCALCGLSVEIEGFSVMTHDGLLRFCCAGCLSVYRLFNGDKIIE